MSRWLLVFVPVAIALDHLAPDRALWIFLVAGIAVLPLAGLMGRATEELSVRSGYMLSGWQAEVVARARTSLAGRETPWLAGRAVAGRRLAEIVRTAVARHGAPGEASMR